MNKKEYMTPAVELMEMDFAPLLAGSITSVTGEITELGDGDAPGSEADAPAFGEWRF